MKAGGVICALIFFVLVLPIAARAELPAYILDKDFESCMGGDTLNKERAAYCDCVRKGMSSWDISTYMEAATQAAANAASPASGQMPSDLEALAKQCLAQVLH